MKFASFLLVLVLTCAAPAARAEVLVFAAASLKEPLDQMAADFEDVIVSYGGSGTLARQVSLGAPADIILLANVDWMDVLIAGAHVHSESVHDFASNRLVVIGPQGSEPLLLTPEALGEALVPGRIAVGLTQAVPAGIYAKAALQSLGLWSVAADRLAEVDNVRSALALVIRGQAPLGIVYRTDARISDAIIEVAVFPTGSHPPIRYVGALTDKAGEDAAAFLEYVMSDDGQSVLASSGFLPAIEPSQ
jgi:molybdate transport system substrate-binding protein